MVIPGYAQEFNMEESLAMTIEQELKKMLETLMEL